MACGILWWKCLGVLVTFRWFHTLAVPRNVVPSQKKKTLLLPKAQCHSFLRCSVEPDSILTGRSNDSLLDLVIVSIIRLMNICFLLGFAVVMFGFLRVSPTQAEKLTSVPLLPHFSHEFPVDCSNYSFMEKKKSSD